jgi:hypothetical protein
MLHHKESGVTNAVNAVTGFARQAIQNAINNPVATAIGVWLGPVAGYAYDAISNAVSAANRGVTAPDDDSQATLLFKVVHHKVQVVVEVLVQYKHMHHYIIQIQVIQLWMHI